MFAQDSSTIAESMGFVSHYGMSPWMNLVDDSTLKSRLG